MAEEITPALSAAEWRDARRGPDAALELLDRHVQAAAAAGTRAVTDDVTAHLRAAIALANDLLPAGHARKITPQTVAALGAAVAVYHEQVESTFGELGLRRFSWGEMAAALEVLSSLLPPDSAKA